MIPNYFFEKLTNFKKLEFSIISFIFLKLSMEKYYFILTNLPKHLRCRTKTKTLDSCTKKVQFVSCCSLYKHVNSLIPPFSISKEKKLKILISNIYININIYYYNIIIILYCLLNHNFFSIIYKT